MGGKGEEWSGEEEWREGKVRDGGENGRGKVFATSQQISLWGFHIVLICGLQFSVLLLNPNRSLLFSLVCYCCFLVALCKQFTSIFIIVAIGFSTNTTDSVEKVWYSRCMVEWEMG